MKKENQIMLKTNLALFKNISMRNIEALSILMLIAMIILLFTGVENYIFADTSSYYEGDAGVVFPVKNKSIVMQKENVTIKP